MSSRKKHQEIAHVLQGRTAGQTRATNLLSAKTAVRLRTVLDPKGHKVTSERKNGLRRDRVNKTDSEETE